MPPQKEMSEGNGWSGCSGAAFMAERHVLKSSGPRRNLALPSIQEWKLYARTKDQIRGCTCGSARPHLAKKQPAGGWPPRGRNAFLATPDPGISSRHIFSKPTKPCSPDAATATENILPRSDSSELTAQGPSVVGKDIWGNSSRSWIIRPNMERSLGPGSLYILRSED